VVGALGRYAAGFAVLLLLFAAGGWQAQSEETKAATGEAHSKRLRAVTPREALELVKRNKENPNFVIVDMRTPEELTSGYIEGAVNIDYYHPGFQVEVGKLDRTKTYLIYCRTGSRTESAFALMKELQFKEVYPLEGGITAWRAAGFPVAGQKRQ
jgi:rhodanese-related sulfurtransferase